MSTLTAISLFSGLGGIDIGLHRAGVQTAVCVEKDPDAIKTLKANSSQHSYTPVETNELVSKKYPWTVIGEDIYEISTSDLLDAAGVGPGEVDLIVGGPPCQTFSRSNEGNRQGTNADRGMLYEEFARVLRGVQPAAFIFENVRGLASSNNGEDLETIRSELEDAGYRTNYEVLNAAQYGVPQTRKRIIIIGTRSDESEEVPRFPEPTHVKTEPNLTGKPAYTTAKEALSDFDLDKPIEAKGGYTNAVNGKYGYLLKDIPPGGNYQHFSERRYDPEIGEYVERTEEELDEKVFDWRSRHWNYLLKQDPDRPTWTIQAAPGTYVGPFHWRSRPYSLLEQMRLMDIPIDYYVEGTPREIQRQIGNAVPPGLAASVVKALLEQLGKVPAETTTEHGIQADGGHRTIDDQQPAEQQVKNSISPWEHADYLLPVLDSGKTVTLTARGRHIANAIDTGELLRRNTDSDINVEFTEMIFSPEKGKSDVLSETTIELNPQ